MRVPNRSVDKHEAHASASPPSTAEAPALDETRAPSSGSAWLGSLQGRRATASSSATPCAAPADLDAPPVKRRRTQVARPGATTNWQWASLAPCASAPGKATLTPSTGPADAAPRDESAAASAEAPANNAFAKGSRVSATTKNVCQVLTDYQDGVPLATIAAHRSLAPGTVENWTSKARWHRHNFLGTLSKTDDYALYRERLGTLLDELDIWHDPLPEPSRKQSGSFNAHALRTALEFLIAHPEPPRRGQNKPDQIATLVGVKKATVESWITTGGRLKRPVDSVARMEGYPALQDALRALFAQLGHGDIAQSLPATAEGSIRTMTTAQIVEALTMMGEAPQAPLTDIAGALKVSRWLVNDYFAANRSLRDPARVERLPDFAENRDALRAALQALGHAEQADCLGFQKIDASTFLHTLRQDFDKIAAAVDALGAESTLSVRESALRADLPVATLAVIVDEAGHIRNSADIHALLTSFKSYLERGIDEQLERLRNRPPQGAPSATGQVRMKAITFAARGTLAARVHVVRASSDDPGFGSKTRLNGIYANNPDLVQEPRSYEGQRVIQALRWLATTLRAQFPKALEVQCYFHAETGRILVATNSDRVNSSLRTFLSQNGLAAALDNAAVSDAARAERENRHRRNLKNKLAAGSQAAKGTDDARRAEAAVFDAIRHRRFDVVVTRYRDRDKFVEMHAERRIKYALQTAYNTDLDPAFLAGTMRPCGVCADDLGLDRTARRGPFWLSQASQAFVADTQRIIDANVRDAIGTHVTRPRGQTFVTADYGTESDSDVEAPVSQKR